MSANDHSLTFDMSAVGALQSQQAALTAKIKQLINADLREICRGENLAVSGVKAQLQARIIVYLEDLVNNANVAKIDILRHRVYNHGKAPIASSSTPSNGLHLPPSGMRPPPPFGNMTNSFGSSSAPGMGSGQSRPKFATHLRFKESPFYEIEEPLAKTLEMPGNATPQTTNKRNTLHIQLSLSQNQADRLRADNTLRIMLYCAEEPLNPGPWGSMISFPSQIELRVNQHEIKANTKGLKNKKGTTLPTDITGYIKKHAAPSSTNITITYALTTPRFWLVPMLVKKHSVDELTERIRSRSVISRQRVITEMVTKANDPDIEATSLTMPLKDPVSYMRIAYPCRSNVCKHNQCFDTASFLMLQEQAPTWTCPICNKVVEFSNLAIDQYVQDILQQVPKSVDSVRIEPNGQWSYSGQNNGSKTPNGVRRDPSEDSDDLVIVNDIRPTIKAEHSSTPLSMLTPPVVASPSSAASVPRAGQKRKSEVIDLTLSDDDEPRPAKRPAYSTPTSLATPDRLDRIRNGYLPSLSRTSSNHALNTNGNLSYQTQLGSRPSSTTYGGSTNTTSGATPYNNAATNTTTTSFHNSNSSTHLQAGSPLQPITISSPSRSPQHQPQRITIRMPVERHSSGENRLLPPTSSRPNQPSHHAPSLSTPHQQQRQSNATPLNGTNNPSQRNTLLNLAGKRPYEPY